MDVTKLKRELSKVSGVDFFNPKYRAIFKKYAGEGEEEERTDELEVQEANEQTEPAVAEPVEAKAQTEEGDKNEEVEAPKAAEAEAEPLDESDDEGEELEGAEPVSEVETREESEQTASSVTDELLTVKLELELVRAGIREDRLETAKRLFMPEFKASGGDAQQIRELIAQYPEWIGAQSGVQGFGMPIGDKADALTNEEKALKRMGIDPRN